MDYKILTYLSLNGFSHPNQLDKSISNLRVVFVVSFNVVQILKIT